LDKIDTLIEAIKTLSMKTKGFEILSTDVQSSAITIPSPTTTLPTLLLQLKEPWIGLSNKFNGTQSKFWGFVN